MARTRLTRAESRQRTRELLVEAAMRVFARDGYAGASVDAIAAEAGFTVGAVYSNFATKHELFLAAFERHCDGELAALSALVEEHRSLAELLQAVTDRFADLDQAQREWWTLWGELWLYAQRRPDGAARLAAVEAETRKVIATALAREITGPIDQVAGVIHALWTGFMLNRLVDPQAVHPDTFSQAVLQLTAGQPVDTTGGTP